MRKRLTVVIFTLTCLWSFGVGGAAAADPTAPPAPPAPAAGVQGPGSQVPESAAERAASDAKMAQILADGQGATAPLTASRTLSVAQHPQTTGYYCAPASVLSLLEYKGATRGPLGESLYQSVLANTNYLNTTTNGTDWSQGRVAPTINAWLGYTFYVRTNLPSLTYYQNALVSDTNNNYPLIIGLYEPRNSTHLPDHPLAYDIWHYIAAHGYDSSGALTTYADSVYGATSVWFYYMLHQSHYTFSSSSIVSMMSPSYGIVW